MQVGDLVRYIGKDKYAKTGDWTLLTGSVGIVEYVPEGPRPFISVSFYVDPIDKPWVISATDLERISHEAG